LLVVVYSAFESTLISSIVSYRIVDRMAKFDREAMKKTRVELTSLKSTGQSKFALEEEVKQTFSHF